MLAADVRVIHPEDSARVNIPAGFPHALPLRVRHVRREPIMVAHRIKQRFCFFRREGEGTACRGRQPVDGQVKNGNPGFVARMDMTVVGVFLAVAACIAAYLYLGRTKVAVEGPVPKEEAPAKQVPEKEPKTGDRSAEGKCGGTGKKGKKDDKKHPQCLFQLKGHAGDITCSRVSMTGKLIVTSAEDRRLKLWSISSLPPTQTLDLSPELDHGAAIATSPDDKFFAVLFARTKEVKIYPTKGAKEGAHVSFSSKHSTEVTDMIWSYSGRYLVTFACKDKECVRLWTPKGDALGTINAGALEAYSVVVSPDSRFISIATMQCDAKIWEMGADKEGFGLKGKAMELTGRTGGGGAAGHSSAVHR